MASQRELKKLRQILKAVQQGNAKFSAAYSFIDQLQGKGKDEEEDEMIEDCIRPIQKMLHSNRQALAKLKENGQSLMNTLRDSSNRKPTHKTYSNEELDSQINYLTSVLKSKKIFR